MGKCPRCATNLELVSTYAPESRMSLKISPNHGENIHALNFGGMVRSMSRLLSVIGDDAGIPTDVLIDGLSQHEDGTLQVDFLVLRRGGMTKAADAAESEERSDGASQNGEHSK